MNIKKIIHNSIDLLINLLSLYRLYGLNHPIKKQAKKKMRKVISNSIFVCAFAPTFLIYAFGVVSKGFLFLSHRSLARPSVADCIEPKKVGRVVLMRCQ